MILLVGDLPDARVYSELSETLPIATKMSELPSQVALSGGTRSRRQALAAMLGAPALLAAYQGGVPLRFAISETVLGEVNLNDVRPAMQFWIERMNRELSVVIDPKVVNTTQEIQDRLRKGQVDAVALRMASATSQCFPIMSFAPARCAPRISCNRSAARSDRWRPASPC